MTDGIDFKQIQEQAIDDLKAGKSLIGQGGALTPLIKQIIEASLEGEIEVHLQGEEAGPNRRNGKLRKVVKSDSGAFELETPRDRNGSFEPQLVKKRQTILNAALDEKIINLFSLGMSYSDIKKHLAEMYGVEISSGLISSVTDKLIPILGALRAKVLGNNF
jgi:transposase-like protein